MAPLFVMWKGKHSNVKSEIHVGWYQYPPWLSRLSAVRGLSPQETKICWASHG